jgi:hypothetical protein
VNPHLRGNTGLASPHEKIGQHELRPEVLKQITLNISATVIVLDALPAALGAE